MKSSSRKNVEATVAKIGSRPFTITQLSSKSGAPYATCYVVVKDMVRNGDAKEAGLGRRGKYGKAPMRYQLNGKSPVTAPAIKSVKSRRSPLDRALALAEADLDRAQALVNSLRQAKRLEKRA